jgi:hypothetical protein
MPGPEKTLHVRCGSDIRAVVQSKHVDGIFLEWGDPVCQGPVPANLSRAEYLNLRARYICDNWQIDDFAETRQRLIDEDDALQTFGLYEKIILWFEHDLYDQSILIDLLCRIHKRYGDLKTLHILSINAHPDVERFIGYGQLSQDQLVALVGMEIPVTAEMYAIAREAWTAFRASTPDQLVALIKSDISALPFMKGAMVRHLQDLPWTTDGLSLTERLTLQALNDGAETPAQAFGDLIHRRDPQPFLGDAMYWPFLRTLSTSKTAAVTQYDGPRAPINLTDFGRDLLDGGANMAATNGINRWHGGTHLNTSGNLWFWDEEKQISILA